MDLTSLTDDALSALITDAKAEQEARHTRRTAEFLTSVRTQAEALGLRPSDVLSALSKRGAGRTRPAQGSDGRSEVKPKYRSPKGETWAGRGAKPKWFEDHLKSGGKPEDLLITKSAA